MHRSLDMFAGALSLISSNSVLSVWHCLLHAAMNHTPVLFSESTAARG